MLAAGGIDPPNDELPGAVDVRREVGHREAALPHDVLAGGLDRLRVEQHDQAVGGLGTRMGPHVEGERPILVYRVGSLATALEDLTSRGWERESTFEIPHGPCCSFRTPGGHRVALYELVRPEVAEHFAGRFDF